MSGSKCRITETKKKKTRTRIPDWMKVRVQAQEQLEKASGILRSAIVKLERNLKNVAPGTPVKVVRSWEAGLKFSVELNQ